MSGPVVVLVEGESDRVALEALAIRRGLDLAAVGIVVQPRFLERARSDHGAVCGLYDAAEEREVRRALERSGLGRYLAREGIEALGFFACEEDLEDALRIDLLCSGFREI